MPKNDAPSRVTCGVIAIFLGGWGIHKFRLGPIEGIIYLTKTDEEFYQTYVVEKKAWF
jgi:hypothetical protein